MRPVLAVTATALLALTACSTDEPTAHEPTTTTEATQESGPIELSLGETANLTKSVDGPRDIDVTVTGITVAEECRYGLNDWHDDYTHEGGYFIEVSGDIDVKSSPKDFTIPQWAAADEDRNIIEVLPASECAATDEAGVQTFNDSVMAGTKSKATEEYWVDTLPSQWSLNEPAEDHAFSWPVPQDVTPAPEPADEAEPAGVVGMTGAPGHDTPKPLDKAVSHCGNPHSMESGTTFFTDGTTGWTQGCADVMYPQQVEMREQNPVPQSSGDDHAGAFEPAGTPPAVNHQGWHCDGPAYLCRDDNASGKTAGQ